MGADRPGNTSRTTERWGLTMPDLISLMFSAVPIPQRSRGKLPFNSPKLARTNVDINRSSLYGMVRYPRRGLDERILINR